MRKVNCTVLYKLENCKYVLLNVTVKHKHENIELNRNKVIKEYNSLNEMYKTILLILKHNGFYVYSFEAFNQTWYDIDFIDIDKCMIETFSIKQSYLPMAILYPNKIQYSHREQKNVIKGIQKCTIII